MTRSQIVVAAWVLVVAGCGGPEARDHPSPPVDTRTPSPGGLEDGMYELEFHTRALQTTAEDVGHAIRAFVRPGYWRETAEAKVEPHAGVLAVRATPDIHREATAWLKDLHEREDLHLLRLVVHDLDDLVEGTGGVVPRVVQEGDEGTTVTLVAAEPGELAASIAEAIALRAPEAFGPEGPGRIAGVDAARLVVLGPVDGQAAARAHLEEMRREIANIDETEAKLFRGR